jgi:hypothetical protein
VSGPSSLRLRQDIAAFSFSTAHVGAGAPPAQPSAARQYLTQLSGEYPEAMDKKEIESPKLTAKFLIWISAFILLVFALTAHFAWRLF